MGYRKEYLRRKLTCPECRHKSKLKITLYMDKQTGEIHEMGFKHDKEKISRVLV